MFVSVTSQDIAAGIPKSIMCCPIALAVQRATGVPDAWAGPFKICVDGGHNGTHDTPAVAEEFMRRIDAGEAVEPFIFELADAEAPNWYGAQSDMRSEPPTE